MKLPDGVAILPADVVAPEKQILRYTSLPKFYSIPPEAKPTEGELEGLFVRETHEPEPNSKLPGNFGRYKITIEGSATSSGEFEKLRLKIRALAEDLDKFWV